MILSLDEGELTGGRKTFLVEEVDVVDVQSPFQTFPTTPG